VAGAGNVIVWNDSLIRFGSDDQSSAPATVGCGLSAFDRDGGVVAAFPLLLLFFDLVPFGAFPGPRRFGLSAYTQLSLFKQLLHLGLTPVHLSFRTVRSKFPSLLSKLTINYFNYESNSRTSAKVASYLHLARNFTRFAFVPLL